jgi:hypothetical protein
MSSDLSSRIAASPTRSPLRPAEFLDLISEGTEIEEV